MTGEKRYYLDTFSVSEDDLRRLIAEAVRSGGDYADLFFENTSYGNLVLRDGEVTSGGAHVDYGCGIRVLKGEKTGYAYSESTSMAELLGAAKAAGAIASAPGCAGPVNIQTATKSYPGSPNPAADRYPSVEDWRRVSPAELVPFLNRLQKEISSRDSRIVKIMAMLSWQVTDVMMFNSASELKYDTRPMGTVSASVIFRQGDKIENKAVSRSWRKGPSMLSGDLVREMADDVVKGIDERFEARRPKGGRIPVVMGAGASGILLHEAMGHAFEADFNRKGQSVFSGRMGQRICPEGIYIIDDATIPGCRGSLNFDDEGVPGQKTYMVEDGILTSYLHDRISARYFGVSPTGNGRRESFRYHPIPRMRATYMESGSVTPEDIISSVREGIYVDEFSNGQVKIGEGDFTFYVKSGRLIENGRLTMPVKDINIIGNGPEALGDIRLVGNDLIVDDSAWTCGKEQNVPVSCGIPTVLIGGLTVGGE